MKKQTLVASVVIIIAILAVAGFLVYKNFALQKTISEKNNQTAGWKTYANSEYGFEIKYPTGWGVEKTSLEGGFFVRQDSTGGEAPTIIIQFSNGDYSKAISEEQKAVNEKINDINFAGVPAKEFFSYSPVGFAERVVLLSRNNITLKVTSATGGILDPILSTFKFTK